MAFSTEEMAEIQKGIATAIADSTRPAKSEVTREEYSDANKFGFKNSNDFLRTCRDHQFGRNLNDMRFKALSTYSSLTSADGGYTVPQFFVGDFVTSQVGALSTPFLDAVTKIPMGVGSSAVIPVETAAYAWATAGIAASATSEAAAMTQTKNVTASVNIGLTKYTELVPITDELLSDSSFNMMNLNIGIALNKLKYKVQTDMISSNGNGLTAIEGIIYSDNLVSVNRAGSSVIGFADLLNMYSRFAPQFKSNAVWLINHITEAKLLAMTNGATNSPYPLLLPGLDATRAPYRTMLGHDVIVVPNIPDYGTAGDVFLIDPKRYLSPVKGNSPKIDTSMHFWFDQGTEALRIQYRIGGKNLDPAAFIDPNGGTNTLSTTVKLIAP